MAAASQWKEPENDSVRAESSKTAMKQKVRFDAERAEENSAEDEPNPADEDKKKPAEERTSSRHAGISGRIHKRKMPVRRPTAYVSDKSDDKDDEEISKEEKTDSSDAAKQSATLEDRLRELSMKYRQQQCSPDRAANQGTKASCG